MKKFTSQTGMSLVEVMVAVGIAGMVSLAVMKINKDMFKTQKTLEQRSNKLDVQSNLMRLLADQDVCNDSLAGLVINSNASVATTGTQVQKIHRTSFTPPQAPRVFYEIDGAGTTYGKIGLGTSGLLIIKDIRVGNYQAMGNTFLWDDPATPSVKETIESQRGTANLIMTLHKPETKTAAANSTEHSYGTNLQIAASITVVKRTGSNIITSCFADTYQHIEAMCTNLGGEIDPSDGVCKQINIFPLEPSANPVADLTFSITAHGSIRTNGIYIGANGSTTDVAGGAITYFPVADRGGLGVDMAIPSVGQITSSNDIRSHQGNIIASDNPSPSIYGTGGGNIIAKNNIHAMGGEVRAAVDVNAGVNVNAVNAVTAGTTVTANNANPTIPAITAANGHIVTNNGELWGRKAKFSNCAGGAAGIVVTNTNGETSCKNLSQLNCANKPITEAGKSFTVITAFAGYDAASGQVVCKDIMKLDNSLCPAGNYNVGYETSMDGSDSRTATMKPKCVAPGTGCDSKQVLVVSSAHPFGQLQSATTGNVCANGHMAPLDDHGFRCPGSKPNDKFTDPQALAYGCETTSRNDVHRVSRSFEYWTCGEPQSNMGYNPADGSLGLSSKVISRPCRLKGKMNNFTYQQCYDADGEVKFYSKAAVTTAIQWGAYGKGSDGREVLALSVGPKPLDNGNEEDSFCWIKTNSPSGRGSSGIVDHCVTGGCPAWKANAANFTNAKMEQARKCPAGWKFSKDVNGNIYYNVGSQQCESKAFHVTGQDCAHKYLAWVEVYGGNFVSTSENGATWGGAKIGDASGSAAGGSWPWPTDQPHVNDLSGVSTSGFDTVTIQDMDGVCDINNGYFHYATFACFAPVTKISCTRDVAD